MEMLQVLLEDESVQKIINENESVILEGSNLFHQYPQYVKDYIQENLNEFIVPGDLKATYEKMVSFTESSVINLLEQLTEEFN